MICHVWTREAARRAGRKALHADSRRQSDGHLRRAADAQTKAPDSLSYRAHRFEQPPTIGSRIAAAPSLVEWKQGLLQHRRADARVGVRDQELNHSGQSRRVEAAKTHGKNAALRPRDSQRARRARNSIRIQRADHGTATAVTLAIVDKGQEL